jgi:hypothetical protein
MVAVLSRSLELALHFAVLGGLFDVGVQLHHGRWAGAMVHAGIAAGCVIALACAAHVAKRLLGNKT